MGYTTYFRGKFTIDRPVDQSTADLLIGLATTRRMKRNLGPEYGVDGEFFIDHEGFMGQNRTPDIVNYNDPPSTQPSLWCQWLLNDDKQTIQWNGGEKFYEYNDWITYLAQRVLKPRGYKLSGLVRWFGEDPDDRGMIYLKNNFRVTLHSDIFHLLRRLGVNIDENPVY